MSSTIIDSPDAGAMGSATSGVEAHPHHRIHRAWLVAVAVTAAATLGLTLAWQVADEGSPSIPAPGTSAGSAAPVAPAASVGAGLLALAWELTPPSQHAAVCSTFEADPSAAWVAYSATADPASIATRAELSAFLTASC